MTDDLVIRPETLADRDAVRGVLRAAFETNDEADLVVALRAGGFVAAAFVGEHAGTVVGHVLMSPLDAPMRALALAPLGVLPPLQRQGIGARLVEASLAHAMRAGWQAVIVVGDPDYYARFGFSVEAAAGYDCVYAGAHLMAHMLDAQAPRRGALRYAPPFAALG